MNMPEVKLAPPEATGIVAAPIAREALVVPVGAWVASVKYHSHPEQRWLTPPSTEMK
jgi:hypothetical protein